jgi:hypothetical protein
MSHDRPNQNEAPVPNEARMPNEARVAALIEAYGADEARWPADEREAAVDVLRGSPKLLALQAEAETVDAFLAALPEPIPSPALRVALKDIPERRALQDWLAVLWPFGAIWRPATGLAAAMVVGMFVGGLTPQSGDIGSANGPVAAETDPFTLAGLDAFGGSFGGEFAEPGFVWDGDPLEDDL